MVSGIIYKKQSDVVYYFGLRKMNDSLLNENARLRKEMDQIHSIDTLRDTLVYRTAKVINNSTTSSDNYITIDRGSKDGITKGMAVISGTGIVGRVEHVSAHFASVLSILSSKQTVSAKLKDGTTGYIKWEEKQPDVLIMTDLPQQAKIKKGDSVYTSVFSIFSPDILIGTVLTIETVKKNAMQILHLQSSTNFHNLQYVYVIENKMIMERKQLEDSSAKK